MVRPPATTACKSDQVVINGYLQPEIWRTCLDRFRFLRVGYAWDQQILVRLFVRALSVIPKTEPAFEEAQRWFASALLTGAQEQLRIRALSMQIKREITAPPKRGSEGMET